MKREIVIIAHDIRSLWNVGSLFRTCDCFDVSSLILSGYTATPPQREIAKTALGADEWIAWRKVQNPIEVVQELKKDGYRIAGLEIRPGATVLREYRPPDKIALIVGNEIRGLGQDILDVCDDTVFMPMLGRKESLNVAVAAGIAAHHLRSCP